MSRKPILLLEDDDERLERFHAAAARLNRELVVWRDAGRMMVEIGPYLKRAGLVSLDHDLVPEGPDSPDPGDGLQVAKFLATLTPVCPVIVHTSNTLRGDAMEGELELAGWVYRRILPIGDDWIEVDWVQAARAQLRQAKTR